MKPHRTRSPRTSWALLAAALLLTACGAPGEAMDGSTLDGAEGGAADSQAADALADASSPDVPASATDAAIDAPARDGATPVDAGAPAPRFIGRFDTSDPAGPRFAWSGSAIRADFTGTSIAVRLRDPGAGHFFQVVVDGAATRTLATSASSTMYSLATGLPDGAHSVLIHRRDEAFFGEVQFLGFVTDAGRALLPPAAAPERRIEIVGDSITAGYGDEGTSANCMFTAGTENHYLTYGAITARALGADLVTTPWSGIGMYRNYGGETTGTMPELYGRTLPEHADSVWDFARFVPHAVVINLGTNDFATGDPGMPFVTAYLAFVRRVRSNYPAAQLVLALGPLLSGADLTRARTYLTQVITTLRGAGETRIQLIEFPTQDPANGLGCDWHPSLTTHQMMATQLTSALRTALGW